MTVSPYLVGYQEAKAKGERRYFTGLPCVHGHIAERFIANNWCVACEKAWRDRNPAKVRLRCRKWEQKNPEVRRKHIKKWKDNNKEYTSRYNAEWMKANPLLTKARLHRRKVKKLGAAGAFLPSDLLLILSEQGNACVCGRWMTKDTFTVDHVVPISKGGSNHPENIQLLCGACNSAKRDKDLQYWMKQNDFFMHPRHRRRIPPFILRRILFNLAASL